ncbi:MAG TPA: head decoration protein [Phycisphaerales bacterium]|nr:head decoration protein [Phycisphaerales bacterium]
MEIEAGINVPCPKISITVASGQVLKKGTVMGRVSVGGLYAEYDNTNDDGTEVASGILAQDVDSSAAGENRNVDCAMYTGGAFYEDRLGGSNTNLDAAAKADLGGRSVPGRNLFIF